MTGALHVCLDALRHNAKVLRDLVGPKHAAFVVKSNAYGHGLVETALAVAVRDLYTGTRLIRANGFLETSGQLSLVLGPSVVGVLVAAAGQEETRR